MMDICEQFRNTFIDSFVMNGCIEDAMRLKWVRIMIEQGGSF